MRKLSFALIALFGFALFSCGPTYVVQNPNPAPPPPPPPAPEVSYQNFYDALSPYGEWIDNPEYGYVWMPNVGPDFKPYVTNGNWVYTDEGWAWSSGYSWGWAPFHYGRWFFQDGYGWMWIPGNEWAPAWVSWRRSPDYYGWAPLGPSVTVSVAVGGGYNPPPHYWCFVPQQYVTSPHLNNYYVNEQQNVTIIHNTTVIRNTTVVNNTYNNSTMVDNNVHNTRVTVNNYAGGPDPGEVSRVTGTQLRPVAVRESNAPGAGGAAGAFAVYRPRINAAPQASGGNNGTGFHPAPAHVQNLTNVRPVNTATYNNNRGTINNTTVNNTTTNSTSINNSTSNSNTNNTNNLNTSRNNGNENNAGNNTNENNVRNSGQPAYQGGRQPYGSTGGSGAANPNGGGGNPSNVNNGNPANANAGNANAGNSGNGNTGYRGNPNPSSRNPGNPPVTPNTPKPAANTYSGQAANHPAASGSGSGNAHSGQPGNNGNPPKPHGQKGQKPQDNQRKPKPNNPDNRP